MAIARGEYSFPPDPERKAASQGFSLARGALHELYAASQADSVTLCGLALLVSRQEGMDGAAPLLWVRQAWQDGEAGFPYPPGLAELGPDPDRVVLIRARDALSALQAGLEGARHPALGGIIIDMRGEAKVYDLTASRRLALASRASGVPVLVARVAASPLPSAAQTRWRVRAAPSRPLEANASGPPAFELSLMRARNGRGGMQGGMQEESQEGPQEGLRYHVQWDRDGRRLISWPLSGGAAGSDAWPAASGEGIRPPLSGAVVPLLPDRPDAGHGRALAERRAG
jgi:protein ImuA